jgi:hypothetical protein
LAAGLTKVLACTSNMQEHLKEIKILLIRKYIH